MRHMGGCRGVRLHDWHARRTGRDLGVLRDPGRRVMKSALVCPINNTPSITLLLSAVACVVWAAKGMVP